MSPESSPPEVSAADALFSLRAFKAFVRAWLKDKVPLVEACCVALTLHVLAFPVMWFLGWALPWPKSPVVTTIIEIDLRKWPNSAEQKNVIRFRDPELNK